MNIPEGYVLVPVEPTRIQLVAGLATNGIHPIYCAMVAAAQPVEFPAYDEAKERQIFEDSMIAASEEAGYGEPDLYRFSDGSYRQEFHQAAWGGWIACAQSRARSAE